MLKDRAMASFGVWLFLCLPAAAGPDSEPAKSDIEPPAPQFQELRVQPHKFWDQTNIVLYSATAAAATADFWTTRHAISNGGRELNPIARPFAGSDASFAAYKASSVASYIGVSYLFHRAGWHKLERVFPVVAAASDGTAVGFNLRVNF